MSNLSYIADILNSLSHMTTDKTVIDVLLRAKNHIDEYVQSGAILLDAEEEHLVRVGEPIEAIKCYRARTGARLRIAKQMVDAYRDTLSEKELCVSKLLSAAKSQYHTGVKLASDYPTLRKQLNELGVINVPTIRVWVDVLDGLE